MSKEQTPISRSAKDLAKLLIITALIGVIVGLLTALYMTLANWGEALFETSPFELQIGFLWPLFLLIIGGLLVGLIIRYTGEHFRLGSTEEGFIKSKGRIEYRQFHNPSNL